MAHRQQRTTRVNSEAAASEAFHFMAMMMMPFIEGLPRRLSKNTRF